jgi:hypothetical protein
MKVAVVVVGVLLLVAVTVYVVGALLAQSHRVSRSALFRVPPERLFALIDGPQDWRPDITRSETLTDAAGRRLLRETSRDGNTITYELQQSKPPVGLIRRIATENLPYSGAWTFSLVREGGGTRVRITEEGEVYNPIFRFVSRFIIGQHRTIDNYLRALAKTTNQELEIQN